MLGRITDRATFRSLAGARRVHSGPLAVARVDTGHVGPPRVAWAVGRRVGNAVDRNTVRRRLRAAMRAQAERLEPGAAYLVTARPSARGASYATLSAHLMAALDQLQRADRHRGDGR